MFNLDLTWINRFFNEKCVFSFIRQFDGSRKPSVNIAINQQIYKYFKKYFIILKNTGRYVLESTKQRDVRWHAPSCMRSPHHNARTISRPKIGRPRPSHAAFAEISNCHTPKDQVSASAKVTVCKGEYDLSAAEIKTARLMQQQGLPETTLLRWPWVSYSCSSWAWSAVIVTGGCRCRCRGTADFPSVFWCVGVKSDSGRRDSNPGSERSQPKTLTTALPSSDTS